MALAFTLRADDPDTTGATSYATPAFTPSASAGILVIVQNSKASAPDAPSLSSPSWLSGSWTQEQTIVAATGANNRLTIFSGYTVASPGSDLLTTSFGAATQTGCNVQVVDVTGQDVTDFTLQPTTANTAATTSQSVTLGGALASSSSAMFAAFSHDINEVHNPSGGETELVDAGYNTPTRRLSSQYEVNDTTSGITWTTSGEGIAVALEIKVSGTVFNDSGSGTITLSGASSESESHTSSATGTITLTGSGVEVYTVGGVLYIIWDTRGKRVIGVEETMSNAQQKQRDHITKCGNAPLPHLYEIVTCTR